MKVRDFSFVFELILNEGNLNIVKSFQNFFTFFLE